MTDLPDIPFTHTNGSGGSFTSARTIFSSRNKSRKSACIVQTLHAVWYASAFGEVLLEGHPRKESRDVV